MKSRELLRSTGLAFLDLCVLTIASCVHVQLIAPYDERIEKGVTELQKDTTEFFVKIERNGGSDKVDYKNHTKFYDDSKVSTKGLLIRAEATAQNEKTQGQIILLMEKYKSLEEQHKTVGLTLHTILSLESSFDQIFRAILTLEVAKKELTEKKKGE
jgi:hypothetical protein